MHPLYTSLPVDAIWHTKTGFCLREDLEGVKTEFHLDVRIPGSHREYVENRMHDTRQENLDILGKNGTVQYLASGTIATMHARIISTGDNLPLDPESAAALVQKLWDERITQARTDADKASLRHYQQFLLREIDEVVRGRRSNIITITGIIGICASLTRES